MDGVDFESELRLRGLDSRVSAGIALLLASGDAAGTALDVDLLKYEKTLSIMLLYINSVSDCPLHIFFQDTIIRFVSFFASLFTNLAFLGIVVPVLLLPILLDVPLRDDVLLDDLVLMLLLLSSLSVIISFLFKLVLLSLDFFVTLLPGDLSSELSEKCSSFFLFPLSLGCSDSSVVCSDSRA